MPSNRKKNTVVVVRPSKGGGRRRSRSRGVGLGGSGYDPGTELTLSYYKSLCDPFQYPPPLLGWGCMVPSTIVSGLYRSAFTANADGSLLIWVLPAVTASIAVGNAGAAVIPPTTVNFANQPAITANCGEGRVISVGLRAYPDIALTSAPGAVYTGATVPSTWTNLLTLTPNDFVQLPTSHMSIGTAGASATGRPVDPDSFIFQSHIVDAVGWSTGLVPTAISLPFSIPYIVFLGLPASATVYVEAVINIEATQVIAHLGTTVLPAGTAETGTRLCDHWASYEQMHGRVQHMLPPPGRPGEATASSDSSWLSTVASGLKTFGSAALKSAGKLGGAAVAGLVLGAASRRIARGGLPTNIPRLAAGGGMAYGRQFGGYLT